MRHSLKIYSILFFLFLPACLKAQQLKYLPTTSKHLDLKTFGDNLHQSYRDSAVGWAITISKNGKLIDERAGGYKITPGDRQGKNGIAFSTATRLHIASFSKTITALAVAKLVEQGKLKWNDPVKRFLPSYWKLHPDFETMTVVDFVSMKSGLDGPLDAASSCTDSLRRLLAKGPNPEKKGKFNYQNSSHGLLRIVIGYANGYQELQPAADSLRVGIVTANMYKQYINKELFAPAGIQQADCRITEPDPAFHYPFPYAGESGELTGTGSVMNNGDLTDYAGGFGWYLSAHEAAQLINATFVTGNIISKQTLEELFKLEFPFRVRTNTYGEHFGTGGDWGHPIAGNRWRGIHAYFYCFPNDVVVTVFVNSGEGSPTRRVLKAYEGAFK